MAWVEMLLERATNHSHGRTRSAYEETIEATPTGSARKRKRLSHVRVYLPPERLEGLKEDHGYVSMPKRSTCKFCSFLALKHKRNNNTGTPPKISNVKKGCNKCNVHLCKDHWDAYHAPVDDDEVDSD